MKQSKNEKWMVDERQELKMLGNTKIVWYTVMALLAISVWVQGSILSMPHSSYLPECAILFAGCMLQIILNIKDGVLYTKENANRKKVWALYIGTATGCGAIFAIANYFKYGGPWYNYLLTFAILAIIMLAGIVLLDLISTSITKKRIKKLEEALEREENE